MFFAAADAIVLPYRRGYESGVALMAMSYGLPVIASDIPSMKETIENESTGTLFRSGDSGDLCDAVRNALANRSRLNAMANCARERMESERSWAFIGGRTKEVYGRALGCG
jgi:glycosyltransferase involved in cell wall biosynthesis